MFPVDVLYCRPDINLSITVMTTVESNTGELSRDGFGGNVNTRRR